MNPATLEVLKKIDEMFADTDGKIWNNVVVAYSKCDEGDKGWTFGLERNKAKLQSLLRTEMKTCDTDVKVLALSGLHLGETSPDFGELWNFLSTRPPINASDLKPFQGLNEAIMRVVQDRDNLLHVNRTLGRSIRLLFAAFVLIVPMIMYLLTSSAIPTGHSEQMRHIAEREMEFKDFNASSELYKESVQHIVDQDGENQQGFWLQSMEEESEMCDCNGMKTAQYTLFAGAGTAAVAAAIASIPGVGQAVAAGFVLSGAEATVAGILGAGASAGVAGWMKALSICIC